MDRPLKPPSAPANALTWLRRNLFGHWYDSLLTIAAALVVVVAVPPVARWSISEAAFAGGPQACRTATGACWSMIRETWPLFLSGLYPAEERWRVLLGVALLVAAVALAWRMRWRGGVAVKAGLWIVVAAAFMVLIHGGVFGLAVVEPQKWGGVLLTIILAVASQSLAFPFGVVLALCRNSRRSNFLRAAATAYIEIVRSVPLVMVLLMTTLILPLFLPPAFPLNTVLLAAIGILMFSAAAIAEVVRGGLDGLPAGQEEAAAALGLRYSQIMRLVVLPQAIYRVQPALVGTFITFVKGSTLVVAIGLYDLLGAAVLASTNPSWIGHSIEPLLFVAAMFWAICFSLSRYSRRLELRRAHAQLS